MGLEIPSHSAKRMRLLKPNGEIYPPEKLPANRALNGEKIINDDVLSTMDIPDAIQVTYSLEDNSLTLKADSTYMKRILTNLISNSMQAMTNGGKIFIEVERKHDKAILRVKDTGQGIPEEIRERICTPLVTTKPKGQGFGLAVVKKLTEALNGTVTFESELGKGTQFCIELPLSA